MKTLDLYVVKRWMLYLNTGRLCSKTLDVTIQTLDVYTYNFCKPKEVEEDEEEEEERRT